MSRVLYATTEPGPRTPATGSREHHVTTLGNHVLATQRNILVNHAFQQNSKNPGETWGPALAQLTIGSFNSLHLTQLSAECWHPATYLLLHILPPSNICVYTGRGRGKEEGSKCNA